MENNNNDTENLLISLLSTYFDTEFETVGEEKSDNMQDVDELKIEIGKNPEEENKEIPEEHFQISQEKEEKCDDMHDVDDLKIKIGKISEEEEENKERPEENPQINQEKEGQSITSKSTKSNFKHFRSLSEFEEEEEEEEIDIDQILYFKPNQIVLDKYDQIVVKKFMGTIGYETHSLINYIKRNGSSFHAEFFYIILHHLNNQNKFKISGAAKIIEEFIYIKSKSKISLYKALKLLNEEKAEIEIVENVIILLQFLYSCQSISKKNMKFALKILLKSVNQMQDLYEDLEDMKFDILTRNNNHYDINNNSFLIGKLKKDCKILSDQNDQLKNENEKLIELIKQKDILLCEKNEFNINYNDIFSEMMMQSKIEPNLRVYSKKYNEVMSVAYLLGGQCYNVLQKYLPIPNERNIRKKMSPYINQITENLTNVSKCSKIISNSQLTQPKDDPLYVAIAIDAAKFKNIQGKTIIQKLNDLKYSEKSKFNCPYINYIHEDKIYKNVFVFNVQPINKDIKPFPIHVRFTENGSANEDIDKIFGVIKNNLLIHNIIVKFIASDGDHFYDIFHDVFFQKVLELIKQNKSFTEILKIIGHDFLTNDLVLPISDFLHSIKLLRGYFLEGKVNLDILSNILIFPEEMEKYNLGYALSDKTSIGKMKDAYPLKIFSTETVMKSFEFKDFHILFFILPFNLIIESLKNPNISVELRIFLLDISYQFLFFHLFQKNLNKNSIHSRIGITRIINTIIGIGISLKKFKFIKLGNISSHPLENLFGIVRLCCSYDHSWSNIINSIAHGFYIKKLIDENFVDVKKRHRISVAGTTVTEEQDDGILCSYTPIQIFIMLWVNMKQVKSEIKTLKLDITPFFEWYSSYKKIEWNEKIYFPSKLSGSNIDNRYKNDDINDALIIRNKKRKQAKQKEQKEKIDPKIIRNDLNEFEIKAVDSNDIKSFMELLYGDVIKDYINQIEKEREKKLKRKKAKTKAGP